MSKLREPYGLTAILRQKIELLTKDAGINTQITEGYIIALHDVIELWSNIDHSEEDRIKLFVTNETFIDWSY